MTQQVMKNFSDAIAQAKVDVVPKIVMGGGGRGGENGAIPETLLALLLSDKLGDAGREPRTERSVRAATSTSRRCAPATRTTSFAERTA